MTTQNQLKIPHASPKIHPRRVKHGERGKGLYIRRNNNSLSIYILFTPTPSRDARPCVFGCVRVRGGERSESWNLAWGVLLVHARRWPPVRHVWPTLRTCRRVGQSPQPCPLSPTCVITHTCEPSPNTYAHERESFTVVGYSQIGTPAGSRRGDGRGNANR
jgi:hypothetical protein